MIKIVLLNGTPLVFNADECAILREKHRICGQLTGCLARAPRQNVQLGVPLQLMPEEVTLLLEKGAARLVRYETDASHCARVEALYAEYIKTITAEQIELLRQERRRTFEEKRAEILEGKRRKVQRQIEARRSRGETISEEDAGRMENEIVLDEETDKDISEEHSGVQIFTENPWVKDKADAFDAALDGWSYPQTEMERVRCAAFKDLHEKGFFMTNGVKFGGDFLVYPGDPVRFHSFYIVKCIPRDAALRPTELVTFGRLASNVKKTFVLYYLHQDGTARSVTINWTGLS